MGELIPFPDKAGRRRRRQEKRAAPPAVEVVTTPGMNVQITGGWLSSPHGIGTGSPGYGHGWLWGENGEPRPRDGGDGA